MAGCWDRLLDTSVALAETFIGATDQSFEMVLGFWLEVEAMQLQAHPEAVMAGFSQVVVGA
jgi:hypothetical protein